MQVFAPTSDGTPTTGATAVGPSSFWQCCDQLISGDPDYVELSNEGIVTFNFAGTYGPGVCYLAIRYYWGGTIAPVVSFIEDGSTTGTITLAQNNAFATYQRTGPTLVGGSALKVKIANQVGNVGVTRISYMQAQVNNQSTPNWPLVAVQPTTYEDSLAGGICSRTGFWIPAHDSVFINGRRYSISMANPPYDGDTTRLR